MAKKNINSRTDGVTRDVVPGKPVERVFRFPSLGVEVKADSYQAALAKLKDVIKK